MRLLGVGVLVLGACGSSHSVGQPTDGAAPDVPAIDANNPDAAWSWQPLISTSWTMAGAPSGSWGNRCVEIPIAQEMWIDGFRPTAGMGSGNDHQILLVTSQVVADGSCQDTLADGDSMIYASGLGPNEQLTLPAGNAVHLMPGSYLLLNSHIVDDTPNVNIGGTSGVDVHVVADSSTVAHDVDMVLGGEAAIDVPHNDTPYVATGICSPTPNAGDQWHLVTLWPHMHESGTHAKISIQNVANGPITTVLDTDYSFMNEQFYAASDALVDTGGKLEIDCTMQNAGALDLHYDEAEPEFAGGTVCWTGIYKYPTGGKPHLCVEGL